MAASGLEVVLSFRNEGPLGQFVGVGLGGTLVELLDDISYWPLPFESRDDLEKMLGSLRLGRLFSGYRERRPVDREWLFNAIGMIHELMLKESLTEVEINPVILYEKGGVIVDAVVR
jgi:hypothetical protein